MVAKIAAMNSRPMTDQALMSGFMTDTSYANTLLDAVKGRSPPHAAPVINFRQARF